ncbi:2-amino-4-hydroxy-6-hydroxymethyldihydropteridine diphosphokinase [Endozoicomonas sp. 8E]|uniref:2-amino-4-hydroxy-6- hydroxymethyldihydropteridine diphosphokinase n=1 Tax=Endozoicomonas sp. 8E TaxID=3035692 RepID=UPI002939103E|nr:2-amino-4-hydroxy-6-hydroxymethyldihydropteridine diphosphokinase [Endozoicomonas sp. 8E]WOG29005.1 2-amino-4-hydroxy-6-hydroxymethyldihydropteridine diphosphokinase [Endozoicomonas sp. 8E]
MTLFYIGVGSNDEAEQNCWQMIQALRQQFGTLLVSSLIQTSADGAVAEERVADYYNAVACFESDVSSALINGWCKQVEDRLGRVRGSLKCRADLDILQVVDDVREVKISTIEEVYYRPLVKQLWNFQMGRPVSVFTGAINLVFETGVKLGDQPRLLPELEFEAV